MQADGEAQHKKLYVYHGELDSQALPRFWLYYNVQVGSHRKLAFLKDKGIYVLQHLSRIISDCNEQFCIFKNFSVKPIEYNFPFCFPVISERVSHFIVEYVTSV